MLPGRERMNWRVVVLSAALLGAAGWWWASRVAGTHGDASATAAVVESHLTACTLPPRVAALDPPRQTPAPASLAGFRRSDASLTPLAGFSIDARVLSRRDYRSDREARYAPTDLALGWGRMRDDAVLGRLTISQSARWYRYRYSGEPPIPQAEIDRSAANMHMIPGSDAIADALADVKSGERVRIDGWLVEARTPDGWRWRSSTTRDDTGAGACEVVYVCAITRL
ncbi:hypothetical protein ACFPOA_15205 [Lysobacter niabensis]|uniref:hypothetical protein n=1 Tax=Agrilutibacter niabensis TaxID=380628 RepID=UPI0036221D4C